MSSSTSNPAPEQYTWITVSCSPVGFHHQAGWFAMRHFLSLFDVSSTELNEILAEAVRLKADLKRGHRPLLLTGRVLGLIFEKPSLRTRASFEAGMAQLGGSSIFLSSTDGP